MIYDEAKNAILASPLLRFVIFIANSAQKLRNFFF